MRVLLDEQLPRQLAREIKGHEVSTVQQRGWAGLKNGELLRRAAHSKFEVFVTADRNLEFQQTWRDHPSEYLSSSPRATLWKIFCRLCHLYCARFRIAGPAIYCA
jgi:hypothetical protein